MTVLVCGRGHRRWQTRAGLGYERHVSRRDQDQARRGYGQDRHDDGYTQARGERERFRIQLIGRDPATAESSTIRTRRLPSRRAAADPPTQSRRFCCSSDTRCWSCSRFALGGIVSDQEYLESRCSFHNLDCTTPWVAVAAWIAWGGSGLLFILDLVFAIRWMTERRLAFYVPLLGCVGQAVVFVATEVVGG